MQSMTIDTATKTTQAGIRARVEHCALDSSGVTGGSICGARLDDGIPTGRTACDDERTAWGRIALIYWSS